MVESLLGADNAAGPYLFVVLVTQDHAPRQHQVVKSAAQQTAASENIFNHAEQKRVN